MIGQCPVCNRYVRLTPALQQIKTHVTRGERCAGMGQKPVPGTTSEWPTGSSSQTTQHAEIVEASNKAAVQAGPENESEPGQKKANLWVRIPLTVAVVGLVVGYIVMDQEKSRNASSAPSYESQDAYSAPSPSYAPRTPPNYQRSSDDNAFLNALSVDPFFDGVSQADAIIAAHEVCNTLDTGMYDVYSVGTAALNNGFDVDSTLVFVASAVGAYCEEYETQF